MPSFEDRKKAFESKFAHDAAMQFKAESRRNRLLGLWAADLLGRTGEAANEYVREVIKADFKEAGDEDVFRKIKADLAGKADDATIRARMNEFYDRARGEILDET